MLQMVGVIVLALGLPDVFASIDEGETVDNRVMVAGYIVMRVAMVFQWSRAARQNPQYRPACLTYITTISVAQVGWLALLVADTTVAETFVWAALLIRSSSPGPFIAERRKGGTPWHAHHIAERYGLLIIIALGEGIIGTIVSLSAVVGPEGPGWSVDAVLIALAGVGLTFGLWWIYFVVPWGEILHARRAPVVRLGLRAHPGHRRGRRRGWRSARRGLLPGGRVGARRVGDAPDGGHPGHGVLPRHLRPLRVPRRARSTASTSSSSRAPRCCSSRRW